MLSVASYKQDLLARRAAEKAVRQFTLDRRRPFDAETARLAPAGDLAAGIVANAALADALGSVRLTDLDASLREAWLESVRHTDEELRVAQDLMQDAAAARPGWADHRFRLGALAYAAKSRPPELWMTPLHSANRAAPGEDAIPNFLAAAYLETWSTLAPEARANAPAILKRAFLDSDFVSRGFLPAVAALGRGAAFPLLPDATRPLRAAVAVLSRSGDVEGAAFLFDRLERAEQRECASDLLEIEQRYRLGDVTGLRDACRAWASAHPVREHDRPEGRAQAARVLELWPNDTTGRWLSDPRADLVRFFLNGRESDVSGDAVARAVEALSGVPDTVEARAKLLAGDLDGVQTLVGRSQT
ncbi:MAG: hypothetical protein ACRD00_04435, partial [Thermoanaerobaculia bacterium]